MDLSTAALASLINGQYIPSAAGGRQRPAHGNHAGVLECENSTTNEASLHCLSSLQGLLQSCGAMRQVNSDGQALQVVSAAPSSAAAASKAAADAAQKLSEAASAGAAAVLHAQLQSQLLAALAGTPVLSASSAQTTADTVSQQFPRPAVATTDAAQLSALLTVMQEPQGKPR